MDDKTDIQILQIALATLGFDCLVNGNLDERTQAALRDFQRNMSLPISGQPDELTVYTIMRLRHAWEAKGYPVQEA